MLKSCDTAKHVSTDGHLLKNNKILHILVFQVFANTVFANEHLIFSGLNFTFVLSVLRFAYYKLELSVLQR